MLYFDGDSFAFPKLWAWFRDPLTAYLSSRSANKKHLTKCFLSYSYRIKKGKTIMYFIYDTKTKINRGFADTKEEAKLLLKELSHKWYYRYLVIR
jgi:hypothetical protein